MSLFAAHHDLAERAAEIVRAAEREAARLQRELDALRRDAEGEARRHLAPRSEGDARRHLAPRSEGDALVEARVRRVRALIGQLIEQADVVAQHLDALIAVLEKVRADRVPAPGETADAARLMAVELAVAGRTREETDRQLRGAFRIADTGPVLDDVFGESARLIGT